MSAPRLLHRALALLLAAAAGTGAAAGATRVVGAAEFRSWNTDHHEFDFAGGFLRGIGGANTGCVVAPLDLRRGSILRSLRGHFLDEDETYDFRIDLHRKLRGDASNAESLASVATSGSTGGVVSPLDTSISAPVVDDGYVYYLDSLANCLDGPDQRLYDVVLELDEAIFLDGFESGSLVPWQSASQRRDLWVSGASFGSALTPGFEKEFNPLWGTVTLPNGNSVAPPCLIAPVELPHLATVDRLFADLYDDRPDRALTLDLRRAPINSAVPPGVLASVVTSGSPGWLQIEDGSIDDALIDNSGYWYYLQACSSGGNSLGSVDLLIQAVKIVYTLP